jgi:hypothetical protein
MNAVRFAALTIATVLAAAPAAASAPLLPNLGIASRQPLVLVGRNFHAAERVSVRVALAGRSPLVRRADATAAGTFRVRFPLRLGRCGRLTAQAFGSEGSRARLLPLLLPSCVPSGDE